MIDALRVVLRHTGCRIVPQYPVAGYRVDIAVLADSAKIAVECDGYAFHFSTPDQAANDKKRERALIINGFTVIRFTGKEINEDAEACAGEVLTVLRQRRLKAYADTTKP